ncbi:MAG TPA: hypothetical protein VLF21_00165 [Candidatus Saccharimonadales bacterium]|nr:hypothetical protein [Candidatus Saccharimonadales bacterium]
MQTLALDVALGLGIWVMTLIPAAIRAHRAGHAFFAASHEVIAWMLLALAALLTAAINNIAPFVVSWLLFAIVMYSGSLSRRVRTPTGRREP